MAAFIAVALLSAEHRPLKCCGPLLASGKLLDGLQMLSLDLKNLVNGLGFYLLSRKYEDSSTGHERGTVMEQISTTFPRAYITGKHNY